MVTKHKSDLLSLSSEPILKQCYESVGVPTKRDLKQKARQYFVCKNNQTWSRDIG